MAALAFESEDQLIEAALQVLEERIKYRAGRHEITSPDVAKQYLSLRLADRKREHFAVLFLDTKGGVIAYEELFHGTVNGASVTPREVARRALELNAAAVILAHNHPSGLPDPSTDDERITCRIRQALELVEARLLDHIIVGNSTFSFAENGLL